MSRRHDAVRTMRPISVASRFDWMLFICVLLCGLFACAAVASASEAASPTAGVGFGVTATGTPEARVEIHKNADGSVELVEVEGDPWLTDAQAAGKSPVLMYVAAFITFNMVLGAGMTGVSYWEEIR